MAGATPRFGYAYFDFGDTLDSPLNVQKEIERFTLIDRQLYAMSEIFGDGVVSGWTITDAGGLAIKISAGVGVSNNVAIESIFPTTIDNLVPNTLQYIYAVPQNGAEQDRVVDFLATPTQGGYGLLIGTVQTGGTNIVTIDVSMRQTIGFKQIISDLIAQHRHNGVSSPKLDLTQEVQGQLPTSHMADIDASKIQSGVLPTSVLPTIDHSSLKNVGVLTHPQLDSIINAMQSDNIALMGEVTTINLMKLIAYFKHVDTYVDVNFVNELCIIPGVSPDSFIDYENSTAVINTDSNCISGVPELPLDITNLTPNDSTHNNFEIVSINWNTDDEFRNEPVSSTNIAVSNGAHLSVDTVFDRVIDDFEGTVGASVANYTSNLSESNTTQVVYSSSKAQGDTSAQFETINSRSAVFTKTFTQAQDWSSYDELIIFVKNFTATHAGVTVSILNDTNAVIATYILLTPDEVTTDDNLDTGGFAKKTYDISTFARTKVKQITFTTSSISNVQEAFFVDTITLRSNQHLLPQGNLRFRKVTTAPVIFNSVDFDADIPGGTDLQVRVRVAATEDTLPTATFSSLLQSGESFTLEGRVCEIDITLFSDATKTATPNLNGVTLNLLTPATTSGLTIADAAAWRNGLVLSNIDIVETDETYVEMKNTNVGDFYFINESQVSELDPTGAPVVGLTSQGMPISPQQGETAINPPTFDDDPYGLKRRDTRGLYKPLSAYRLDSGNYMVADTYNDRVMEITPDGLFVRGYGSHNYDTSTTSLYALTSCYNPRLGVLFITFSQTTDVRNFDLTRIRLIVSSTQTLQLSNEADKVRLLDGTIVTDRTPGATSSNPPTNLTGDVERTLSVFLSEDKRLILNNANAMVSCSISTNVKDRIECFIGDFMFFGSFGIHRPIYANMSGEDTVIVANSSILSEFTKVVETFPVIEFTTRVGELVDGSPTPLGTTFTYDQLLFSDIMIGSLQVIETITDDGQTQRKLLIAGLKYNQDAALAAANANGGDSTTAPTVFSVTLPALDDKKMLLFTGIVRMLDMTSQLVTFEYQCGDGKYPSDAYLDDNGNVVVAESTFTAQSGRIITLDVNGIGDGATPPIIKLIEGGVYTKIWDIRKLKNDHIYVST